MKKLVAILAYCLFATLIFASNLIENQEIDEFGDLTENTYLTFPDDLTGTFKTYNDNGSLKWNVYINMSTGELSFILKENDIDKNITSTNQEDPCCIDSNTKYLIKIKKDDGSVDSFVGILTQSDNYKQNKIVVYKNAENDTFVKWDCLEYLFANQSIKLSISNDYGMYSLGLLDLDDIDIYVGVYHIGEVGPAGGYVFYDCDADNNTGNADGLISSECGWRYLEAAPNVFSNPYCFGYYKPDGITCTKIGKTETSIGSGKANTEILTSTMEGKTYSSNSSTSTEFATYLAQVCINYKTTVNGIVYDDWFVPSLEELELMYKNLHNKNDNKSSASQHRYYGSSSEKDRYNVFCCDFLDGSLYYSPKNWDLYLWPVRSFSGCNYNDINHAWNDGIEIEPATCTTEGLKLFTCAMCGQTKTEKFIESHSYVNYRCSVCKEWGQGPTGGYVFYDCDADNNYGNADGLISSECGWRYLEAAPNDLKSFYTFGFYKDDSANYLNIGTTETVIGTGKSNTELIVDKMGKQAGISRYNNNKGTYAAWQCCNYSITVNGIVYNDWFLPSKDELDLMYTNLHKNGLGSFLDISYWSSSEDNSIYAFCINFLNGNQYSYFKDQNNRVRPIRAFL